MIGGKHAKKKHCQSTVPKRSNVARLRGPATIDNPRKTSDNRLPFGFPAPFKNLEHWWWWIVPAFNHVSYHKTLRRIAQLKIRDKPFVNTKMTTEQAHWTQVYRALALRKHRQMIAQGTAHSTACFPSTNRISTTRSRARMAVERPADSGDALSPKIDGLGRSDSLYLHLCCTCVSWLSCTIAHRAHPTSTQRMSW